MRIDIELVCNECGRDVEADEVWKGSRIVYRVTPCERCVEKAQEEGEKAGRIDGRAEVERETRNAKDE